MRFTGTKFETIWGSDQVFGSPTYKVDKNAVSIEYEDLDRGGPPVTKILRLTQGGVVEENPLPGLVR